jgi:glycosyltransferase involved in cell wall biosynthesis
VYKGKKIAVVVPAHNEEPFIAEVIETMPSFVDRIYVTNDASTDGTGNILRNIVSDRLVVTNNQRRMGAGAAMLSGYKRACSDEIDAIAIMAGDGQMDPTILERILEPVVEGKADYSKGDRLSLPQHRDGMPAWRAFGNFLLTYLTRIASGYWHISDPQNGYTSILKSVLERVDLDKVETGFAFENDLLVKLHVCGARVVNVSHPARYRGERSKIKYLHFMATTSWLLLKDFLWRLWVEYARRPSSKTQG